MVCGRYVESLDYIRKISEHLLSGVSMMAKRTPAGKQLFFWDVAEPSVCQSTELHRTMPYNSNEASSLMAPVTRPVMGSRKMEFILSSTCAAGPWQSARTWYKYIC